MQSWLVFSDSCLYCEFVGDDLPMTTGNGEAEGSKTGASARVGATTNMP